MSGFTINPINPQVLSGNPLSFLRRLKEDFTDYAGAPWRGWLLKIRIRHPKTGRKPTLATQLRLGALDGTPANGVWRKRAKKASKVLLTLTDQLRQHYVNNRAKKGWDGLAVLENRETAQRHFCYALTDVMSDDLKIQSPGYDSDGNVIGIPAVSPFGELYDRLSAEEKEGIFERWAEKAIERAIQYETVCNMVRGLLAAEGVHDHVRSLPILYMLGRTVKRSKGLVSDHEEHVALQVRLGHINLADLTMASPELVAVADEITQKRKRQIALGLDISGIRTTQGEVAVVQSPIWPPHVDID